VVRAKCSKEQLGQYYHGKGLEIADLTEPEEIGHKEVPQPFYDKSKDKGEQYSEYNTNEYHAYYSQGLSGPAVGREIFFFIVHVFHFFLLTY
jgi:hypothetical protein